MKTIIIIFIFGFSFISCNKNESPTDNNYEGVNHITAIFKFNEIKSYAQSEDSVLRLKNIVSDDVNYDGYSNSWSYKYSKHIDSNFVTSKHYYLSSFYDSIHCDSIVVRESTVGDAFISQSWLNSDIALEIAESNGGREFRKNNSSYNISASLSEAVVPNAKPIWNIRYTSKINESISLYIRINAVSGTIE
jgi:hypothetical protein